jgi:signal transduction histidine kinase
LVPESELVAFETRLETAQRVPVVVSVAYPDQTSRHGTLIGDSVISAAIAAGLLLTTTTVVLYGLSGRNRSRRERSERQRLVQRLASTSDHERREIVGALHDGPVQDLVSVSLALATVATAAPPPLDTRLRELADTTRTAVTDVRALLSAIYPVPVPPDGWLAGITDLIEALRDAGVAVQVDVPAARYSASNELLMMRVSREALRNVSAHAHARSVSISVTHWGRLVHLAISDDGIGFDDVTGPTRTSAGHFGIQLVRDLACELGATLTIASAPGSGTVVGLELKEES